MRFYGASSHLPDDIPAVGRPRTRALERNRGIGGRRARTLDKTSEENKRGSEAESKERERERGSVEGESLHLKPPHWSCSKWYYTARLNSLNDTENWPLIFFHLFFTQTLF